MSATSTIDTLKEEVLSGLNAHASFNQQQEDPLLMPMDVDDDDPEWEVTAVQNVHDFELAKAVKRNGRATGKYDVLEGSATLKTSLMNWDSVFIQFRNQKGECPISTQI